MDTNLIHVGDAKVGLRRAGSGAPLLYLHGSVGDPEWLPLHEQLATRFTVYHPAHPGFGSSTGIENIDGIDDLCLHYADLIEALGLDDGTLTVVGASFGGWIAAELAYRWPRLIKALVLIDAAGLWLDEAPMQEIFGVTPQELAQSLFHDQSHPIAAAMASITDVSQLPEEVLLSQYKAMEAVAKICWNPYFHNPKLERRLARIKAKTLVLWGRDDKLIPLAHGQRYAAKIPGARLEIVEAAGHLPVVEQGESTAAAILKFL